MYIAIPARSRVQPPGIFAVGVSPADAVLAAKIRCSGDSARYDRDALSPELVTLPCSDALAARYAQGETVIDYRIVDNTAQLTEELADASNETGLNGAARRHSDG